ncbi:MAG TPA: hypothetical protein VJ729_14840 [Nitrososphaeraceae archaeon]|nr:hypothetical protein [Nitrososphaeraceae archaeon]
MTYKKLIAVSDQTYLALKQRGKFGDSFNDIVVKLLHNSEKGEMASG